MANPNNWKSLEPQAQMSSWSQKSGFQASRAGFGYSEQPRGLSDSLDQKVADVDAKLADFMAEINSLEAEPAPDAPNSEDNTQLLKTTAKGFVSGGHILPTSTNEDSPAIGKHSTSVMLVEPSTTWQHLLDANTQHYYYWDTVTNEVQWTIPDAYSEYLVKHKMFRESVEAAEAKGSVVKIIHEGTASDLATNNAEEVSDSLTVEEEAAADIIGPQLPPTSLPAAQLPAEPIEEIQSVIGPSLPTSNNEVTHSVTDLRAIVAEKPSNSANSRTGSSAPQSLVGLIGYSDEQTDSEEEVDSHRYTPPRRTYTPPLHGNSTSRGMVSSLVAYDESYDMERDVDLSVYDIAADFPEPNEPEPPEPEPEIPEPEPELPEPEPPEPELSEPEPELSEPEPELSKPEPELLEPEPELLEAEPVFPEPEIQEKALLEPQQACSWREDAPLIFTKAPPPPPEPAYQASKADVPLVHGPAYLTSSEISSYSELITDKLAFLDVTTDDVSRLQMLLVQLKTRLDDWLAGALKQEYLVDKIREADGLLEDCEKTSAPAGWKCAWSKKEKKYYYIHEITEEIMWDYPSEDLDHLHKIAAQKLDCVSQMRAGGTLANLEKSVVPQTASDQLCGLFADKILERADPSTTTPITSLRAKSDSLKLTGLPFAPKTIMKPVGTQTASLPIERDRRKEWERSEEKKHSHSKKSKHKHRSHKATDERELSSKKRKREKSSERDVHKHSKHKKSSKSHKHKKRHKKSNELERHEPDSERREAASERHDANSSSGSSEEAGEILDESGASSAPSPAKNISPGEDKFNKYNNVSTSTKNQSTEAVNKVKNLGDEVVNENGDGSGRDDRSEELYDPMEPIEDLLDQELYKHRASTIESMIESRIESTVESKPIKSPVTNTNVKPPRTNTSDVKPNSLPDQSYQEPLPSVIDEPSIDDILEGIAQQVAAEKSSKLDSATRNNTPPKSAATEDMEISDSEETESTPVEKVATIVAQPAVIYHQPPILNVAPPQPTNTTSAPPHSLAAPPLPSRHQPYTSQPVLAQELSSHIPEIAQHSSSDLIAISSSAAAAPSRIKLKRDRLGKKAKSKMPDLVNKWKKVQSEVESEIKKEETMYKKYLAD